jgi:hypothetical protein
MDVANSKTDRGFRLNQFDDLYGVSCSLQESSLATGNAVWFGVSDVFPKILATDAIELGLIEAAPDHTGWIDFQIPEAVQISTRMYLSQDQVKQLLTALTYFAEHGELPSQDLE